MQQHQINHRVGFCRFDDCTIVLDVAADRYWRLSAEAGRVLAGIEAGDNQPVDPQMLAYLVDLKLIAATGTHRAARTGSIAVPRQSVLDTSASAPRSSLIMAAEIVALVAQARRCVRRRSLGQNLENLACRRTRLSGSPTAPVADLARHFHRYRHLLPGEGTCLPDSLALLWFVMRRRHQPKLVFGVEAYPFAAHCWVQQGDVVLSDLLDYVTLFRPILAL